MSDEPRRAEPVASQTAPAPTHGGNGPSDEASIRTAFLERASAVLERIADTVEAPVLRAALEADTDAGILAALGLGANGVPKVPAGSHDPLAAAKRRGEQAKRDILAMQGDLLDASEVASRLGLSKPEVEARRQVGLLLALPLDDGTLGFPAWQFADGGLLPGLDDVLRSLPAQDPWSRLLFFLSGDPYLDDRTPLELLQRGKIEPVQRLAAAYGELVAT